MRWTALHSMQNCRPLSTAFCPQINVLYFYFGIIYMNSSSQKPPLVNLHHYHSNPNLHHHVPSNPNPQQLQGIHQREHLKQLIINRLVKDYARNSKVNAQTISRLVSQFFEREKVTQPALKQLKQRVIEACLNSKPPSRAQPSDTKSVTQKISYQIPKQPQYRTSTVPQDKDNKSVASKASSKRTTSSLSKTVSQTNLKSVYGAEDCCEDDQWALLVKYDSQMFKKEQDLLRLRSLQQKRRNKQELDTQMGFIKKKQDIIKQEQQEYVQMRDKQIQNYDQRQRERAEQAQRKFLMEKKMRDKQIRDQKRRKRAQQKTQQELDGKLVKKIQEQLRADQEDLLRRKQEQRIKLKELIHQNQLYQQKLKIQAAKQREEQIKLQNKYAQLLQEQEEKRDLERKEREQKIKRAMNNYTKQIISNQKDQLREEDQKMLRYIESMQKRDKEEEQFKKRKNLEQKQFIRDYLGTQVEEKKKKLEVEGLIDKNQADIWKNENFTNYERKKQDYLKEVNLKHQDILLRQMEERNIRSKCNKMNCLEKLYNKALMKQAAKGLDNVKREMVRH